MAPRNLPKFPQYAQKVILIGGTALWFVVVTLHTGFNAFTAFAALAWYILLVLAISSLTRTVPLRSLFSMFMFSTSTMIATAFIIKFLSTLGLAEGSLLRNVFVPLFEETVKIAPVVGLLWMGRKLGSKLYGVSDIMLLAAVSGAGFSLIEDACVLADPYSKLLAWMPVVHVSGDTANVGHAIWTTIGGVTVGFAVCIGFRKPWMKWLACSGFAWSFFDHFANNYNVGKLGGRHPDSLATTINVLHGSGWLSLWLVFCLCVAAVFFDLLLLNINVPHSDTTSVLPSSNLSRLRAWWDITLWRRRLGYITNHLNQVEGKERELLSAFRSLIANGLAPHSAQSPPAKADVKP